VFLDKIVNCFSKSWNINLVLS